MNSTFKNKFFESIRPAFAWLFWLGLWQALSILIDNPIFLPAPKRVGAALLGLVSQKDFYIALLNSFLKIVLGFGLASVLGTVLGLVSYSFKLVERLARLPLGFMRSVPLVCFVILLLIWTNPTVLPIIISFMLALPLISNSVLAGLRETDPKLLEMAAAFQMSWAKKLRYIYFYQVFPFLKDSLLTTAGLVFKASITAELIGLSENSIGEMLYFTKLYLKTDELFAWIIIILLISLAFEKALKGVLEKNDRI